VVVALAAVKFRACEADDTGLGRAGPSSQTDRTMPLAPLATVKHRVQLGQPLPFGVRDADGALLLARGHVVESPPQLEALLARGAMVEISELIDAPTLARQAPREQLPRLWGEALTRMDQTLAAHAEHGFAAALDEASAPLAALVARDPDLAIFQVLSQRAGEDTTYGARRSLQTAVTALLVARRLGWDDADAERAFKVALTMNLSMLELQGQLARQAAPPTPAQRQQLQTHPMRSVRLLEQAGVADGLWLEAVLQHHELEDGTGYPSGRSDVCDLASLVRRSDVYTSKLASRSTRDALAADVAGRQMFLQDPGHPMTAALVKEFGIYPPGCHVRLHTGELAIVVARGGSISTPVVACLTDAIGRALPRPERLDTAAKGRGVAAVVGLGRGSRPLPLERLMAALAG
jgi:HD-GYP domain-containing protein (c-di-GMP phosphodiesterase class II)